MRLLCPRIALCSTNRANPRTHPSSLNFQTLVMCREAPVPHNSLYDAYWYASIFIALRLLLCKLCLMNHKLRVWHLGLSLAPCDFKVVYSSFLLLNFIWNHSPFFIVFPFVRSWWHVEEPIQGHVHSPLPPSLPCQLTLKPCSVLLCAFLEINW